MPAPLSLSIAQARRLVLAAQGFAARPRRSALAPAHLMQVVQRLGVLQIDSVNAVVRSHYLPLFSRLGDYPHAMLDALAWGRGRERKLFEYWGHEASLLPLHLYPAMAWRMARAREGRGIYKELARFGVDQKAVVHRVLDTVREQGALGAGSLSTRQERAGPWWDWSSEKLALEWLFAAGQVTVAGRRGFERLYDLPERVIPAAILSQPIPDEARAHGELLLHAAGALGVATEKDLRDYFRLDPADTRQSLAQLIDGRQLQRCEVAGWRQPAYCLPQVRVPRRVEASALLSPFDSLVWERDRTERLFGFRYRLEIYTPAHKRVYGYYVLPFLYNERIVARVDVRAARASAELRVLAVHGEGQGLDQEALLALARQLTAMAGWLGLAAVTLECTRRPELHGLLNL
ncbi:winged helix-turn-helix domain-containing protein [Pseudomonas sp.]|uniref:winged helix-turn-helix domain-containing protein n=1 Tax=Pseudomonas sp. TaxID=306 RepID=UPI003CC533F6